MRRPHMIRLPNRHSGRVTIASLGLLIATHLINAPLSEAHITRVEIKERETPTFGGYSWAGVGRYEKIVGKAFGEVDPNDPRNATIVDLRLAPRNARGMVEYAFDFYLLKPIDLAAGN